MRQHLCRVIHHYQYVWARYDWNSSAFNVYLRYNNKPLFLAISDPKIHISIDYKAFNARLRSATAVKFMVKFVNS